MEDIGRVFAAHDGEEGCGLAVVSALRTASHEGCEG